MINFTLLNSYNYFATTHAFKTGKIFTNMYQLFIRNIRHIIILVILGCLTSTCARVAAPGGGPKDTKPPQLIKTYPAQGSVHFKGNAIKLVFNKGIEVNDLKNKLVITPTLQKLAQEKQPSYTYSVYRNTLTIKLKAPLEEQTTYTFNFNDAIKDDTEGNVANSPLLSFSTGEQLDAMYVTGQVKHLMTHQPADQAVVSLYKADEECAHILKRIPDYLIKADTMGNFRIDHIKPGHYYIYASTYNNNTFITDPGKDEYGFVKDPIDLTTAPLDNITLVILKADVREFKLEQQSPQNQHFILRFNKPVADYELTWIQPPKRYKQTKVYSHLAEDQQTIQVYNTFGLLDEDQLAAHLTATDMLGAVIKENITIRFRDRQKQDNPAIYTFAPTSGQAVRSHFVGTMTLNKPVKTLHVDRLAFLFGNQNAVALDNNDVHINAHRNVITIKKQLDPDMLMPHKEEHKAYEKRPFALQIKEGAFVTVEGDSNESMHYIYTFRDPKVFGTISGTVTTEAPGFIVQLLDLESNVIESLTNERNYQFRDVAPGSYRIRILVLNDREGVWNCGNIHERREPDPVVFYPVNVAVIANWEISGIDLDAP